MEPFLTQILVQFFAALGQGEFTASDVATKWSFLTPAMKGQYAYMPYGTVGNAAMQQPAVFQALCAGLMGTDDQVYAQNLVDLLDPDSYKAIYGE